MTSLERIKEIENGVQRFIGHSSAHEAFQAFLIEENDFLLKAFKVMRELAIAWRLSDYDNSIGLMNNDPEEPELIKQIDDEFEEWMAK